MNRKIILSALTAISASLAGHACQDKSSDLKEVKSKKSNPTKDAKTKPTTDAKIPANAALKSPEGEKPDVPAKSAGQAKCAPGGCAPGKCGGTNHEGTKAKADGPAPAKKDKS